METYQIDEKIAVRLNIKMPSNGLVGRKQREAREYRIKELARQVQIMINTILLEEEQIEVVHCQVVPHTQMVMLLA